MLQQASGRICELVKRGMSVRSPYSEEGGMAVTTCVTLGATPIISPLMLLVEEVRLKRSEFEPGKKRGVGERWF